jgi:hypothetical protein
MKWIFQNDLVRGLQGVRMPFGAFSFHSENSTT